MKGILRALKDLTAYPSAIVGLAIIGVLLSISIYTIIAIPYEEAITLWRGGEEYWYDSPKNAKPTWYNLLRRRKLPETIVLNTVDDGSDKATIVPKNREVATEDMTEITMDFSFDYPYQGFPQELIVFFDAQYEEKVPYISLMWSTPDGREIRVADFSLEKRSDSYRPAQDDKLTRRLDGQLAQEGLFVDPNSDPEGPVALLGTYTLNVSALVFEDESDVDAELVLYGQVHGLAGTDHRRRDLLIALAWGTPIALTFGLLAAVGTTITTMIIAGVGTWFGGWVDEGIQRITEVNMILPVLPILIMVGAFYSRSIWLMLGCIILLNIFGGTIKTYRAVFLQVKQAPYIEAARAYGAGNRRLIFTYLIPRIVPMLIPALVVLVPTFVFIEAALSVLGLGDPVLPTWGKVINDANGNGALYEGYYYWLIQPAVLLMLTGLAFSLVGYSLDRIFNPRLRGV